MNTKSDQYKMAAKIILITFLNTNWINSKLKRDVLKYSWPFLDVKNENVDQGQKGIDLKKNVPSLNNDVCDCHTFENRCLFHNGTKNVFKLNLYFIWFHEILYKKLSCSKVETVFHPSRKHCVYFSKKPPNETMTLYAVKMPNGFDFKQRKCILEW